MKKFLPMMMLVFFGLSLSAQCPLTQAVDFTATDTHGIQHTLSDYLDDGKYVLIDFFFTT
jgi:cytochrome oxidase Cu insertion factor (SCO1/SenC/PrrC family)